MSSMVRAPISLMNVSVKISAEIGVRASSVLKRVIELELSAP